MGLPILALSTFLRSAVDRDAPYRHKGRGLLSACQRVLWASLAAPLPLPSPNLEAGELCEINGVRERLFELAVEDFFPWDWSAHSTACLVSLNKKKKVSVGSGSVTITGGKTPAQGG